MERSEELKNANPLQRQQIIQQIETLKLYQQQYDTQRQSMQQLQQGINHMSMSPHSPQPAIQVNCPGKHGLIRFITPIPGYGCDSCKKTMAMRQEMFGCRMCNFDLCG